MPITPACQFYDDIIKLPKADAVAFIRGMIGTRFEDDYFDCKQEPRQPDLNVRKDNLKRIWSKALSGFANAAGGVLIWGLVADTDPTTKVDKVNAENLVQSPDRLEAELRKLQVEMTDPVLGNVEYQVFEVDDRPGYGFLVCFIPDGPIKPYRERAYDEQYYYRWGDSFRIMPRHMLQRMFYPRATASFHLTADLVWINEDRPSEDSTMLRLRVSITNQGPATAKDTLVGFDEFIRATKQQQPTFKVGEGWQEGKEYFFRVAPLHPKMSPSEVFEFEWWARRSGTLPLVILYRTAKHRRSC